MMFLSYCYGHIIMVWCGVVTPFFSLISSLSGWTVGCLEEHLLYLYYNEEADNTIGYIVGLVCAWRWAGTLLKTITLHYKSSCN